MLKTLTTGNFLYSQSESIPMIYWEVCLIVVSAGSALPVPCQQINWGQFGKFGRISNQCHCLCDRCGFCSDKLQALAADRSHGFINR